MIALMRPHFEYSHPESVYQLSLSNMPLADLQTRIYHTERLRDLTSGADMVASAAPHNSSVW